jgi:hypothetical protein
MCKSLLAVSKQALNPGFKQTLLSPEACSRIFRALDPLLCSRMMGSMERDLRFLLSQPLILPLHAARAGFVRPGWSCHFS